ncbi:hypothetical protein ACOME3_008089 [Neoechinorhynchus agilis]
MANRTVKEAQTIHGTNPQFLIEKIIRSRIYDSRYWKEECFALTAELLADKALNLKYIGGVYGGNVKPTPFLCLTLKMLQIQPEKDIVVEFIKNEDCKYVRALGVFYMRLTGVSKDIYKYLEPLLNDYRKTKKLSRQGEFELVYMDEFIDSLLRDERVCDVQLPRLQKRNVLEANNVLEPRISFLDEEDDAEEEHDIASSLGSVEPEEISSPPPPLVEDEEQPKQRPRMFRHRRTPTPRRRMVYEDAYEDGNVDVNRHRRRRRSSSSSSPSSSSSSRCHRSWRSSFRRNRRSSREERTHHRHRRSSSGRHRRHRDRRNKRSSS